MKNLYYLLFVYIYRFSSRIGEKDLPHYMSISIISICVGFNITSVLTFFEIKNYPNFSNERDFIYLIFMYFINYFIFIHKKRYVRILQENEKRVTKWKVLGSIIVLVYILVSLVIWIYLGSRVRVLNLGL
jgi:heme/copper-type cytochrome/quinol oxidase subunit 4